MAASIKGSLGLPPRGCRGPGSWGPWGRLLGEYGHTGMGRVPILPSGAHCHGDEG